MSIILSSLVTYGIVCCWLRVAREAFWHRSTNKQFSAFLVGGCVASLLRSLSTIRPLSIDTRSISILWSSTIVATAIAYTFLATIEEGSKFIATSISYMYGKVLRSDLILFGILVALWFSFVENIVYITTLTSTVFDAVTLSISRWLTWFLFHCIFTWSICMIVMHRKQWLLSYLLHLAWGLSVWVALHVLYNILISQSFVVGFVLYTCVWYVLLTYFLYHSDRIYRSH